MLLRKIGFILFGRSIRNSIRRICRKFFSFFFSLANVVKTFPVETFYLTNLIKHEVSSFDSYLRTFTQQFQDFRMLFKFTALRHLAGIHKRQNSCKSGGETWWNFIRYYHGDWNSYHVFSTIHPARGEIVSVSRWRVGFGRVGVDPPCFQFKVENLGWVGRMSKEGTMYRRSATWRIKGSAHYRFDLGWPGSVYQWAGCVLLDSINPTTHEHALKHPCCIRGRVCTCWDPWPVETSTRTDKLASLVFSSWGRNSREGESNLGLDN